VRLGVDGIPRGRNSCTAGDSSSTPRVICLLPPALSPPLSPLASPGDARDPDSSATDVRFGFTLDADRNASDSDSILVRSMRSDYSRDKVTPQREFLNGNILSARISQVPYAIADAKTVTGRLMNNAIKSRGPLSAASVIEH